jgi:HPt (histidine-containing phosphotransfer) domain-containing protein
MRAMLERWLPQQAAAASAESAASAPAETAAPSVLERSALESLRALDGDEPHVLRQVIGLYLDDSPKLITAMAEAFDADEMTAIMTAAHTLKSASANVGAMAFSELCRQLETAAQGDDIEEIGNLIGAVQEAFEGVSAALIAERDLTTA